MKLRLHWHTRCKVWLPIAPRPPRHSAIRADFAHACNVNAPSYIPYNETPKVTCISVKRCDLGSDLEKGSASESKVAADLERLRKVETQFDSASREFFDAYPIEGTNISNYVGAIKNVAAAAADQLSGKDGFSTETRFLLRRSEAYRVLLQIIEKKWEEGPQSDRRIPCPRVFILAKNELGRFEQELERVWWKTDSKEMLFSLIEDDLREHPGIMDSPELMKVDARRLAIEGGLNTPLYLKLCRCSGNWSARQLHAAYQKLKLGRLIQELKAACQRIDSGRKPASDFQLEQFCRIPNNRARAAYAVYTCGDIPGIQRALIQLEEALDRTSECFPLLRKVADGTFEENIATGRAGESRPRAQRSEGESRPRAKRSPDDPYLDGVGNREGPRDVEQAATVREVGAPVSGPCMLAARLVAALTRTNHHKLAAARQASQACMQPTARTGSMPAAVLKTLVVEAKKVVAELEKGKDGKITKTGLDIIKHVDNYKSIVARQLEAKNVSLSNKLLLDRARSHLDRLSKVLVSAESLFRHTFSRCYELLRAGSQPLIEDLRGLKKSAAESDSAPTGLPVDKLKWAGKFLLENPQYRAQLVMAPEPERKRLVIRWLAPFFDKGLNALLEQDLIKCVGDEKLRPDIVDISGALLRRELDGLAYLSGKMLGAEFNSTGVALLRSAYERIKARYLLRELTSLGKKLASRASADLHEASLEFSLKEYISRKSVGERQEYGMNCGIKGIREALAALAEKLQQGSDVGRGALPAAPPMAMTTLEEALKKYDTLFEEPLYADVLLTPRKSPSLPLTI